MGLLRDILESMRILFPSNKRSGLCAGRRKENTVLVAETDFIVALEVHPVSCLAIRSLQIS